MSEDADKNLSDLLDLMLWFKDYIRERDKYLFERWKAGGFDITGEFVSMYPSLSECIEQLKEEEDTETEE